MRSGDMLDLTETVGDDSRPILHGQEISSFRRDEQTATATIIIGVILMLMMFVGAWIFLAGR